MDPQLINELEDDIIEDAILQIVIEELRALDSKKTRVRTGVAGHDYVQELLESANDGRIQQVFRMKLGTFIALREWLLAHTTLKSSNVVSVDEKLAIFLFIVTRPASNRDTQERFSHSGDTISR
jgi:hypothetical protein